jgi:formamidopyrimidine-DNA glycosylase
MPELPEVETVMRGLAACLLGRTIVAAEVNRADLRWPLPTGLAARLAGARVESFRRRGKYILMRLSGGDSLLLHLGMSGRMSIATRGPERPVAHEHLVMQTDAAMRVALIDPRRFGSLDLVPTAAEDRHRLLAWLGPEPLEPAFDPAFLSAVLAGKRTPIKAALLDQRVVAGISPRRLAASIAGARAGRLVPAIKDTLTEAIRAGGSSLRDYVQPSGELGYFQHAWKVYGREAEACERCMGPPTCAGITRLVQSGRSTFFCARTQR